MKILIVSYFFPPYNTIGAVRVGNTAALLAKMGHTVKVLTADKLNLADTLNIDLEGVEVVRTPWLDVNWPVVRLLGGREKVAQKGFEAPSGPLSKVISSLGAFYKEWVNFPSGYVGWYPFGVQAGLKLLDRFTPDLILASYTPPTSLLVAHTLSKRSGIPWIAELRDLWSQRNFNLASPRRMAAERALEKRVFSNVSGFTSVSQPLVDLLRQRWPNIPAAEIRNGFDPIETPEHHERAPDAPINILYTGMIYPGLRDPTPLFKAIKLLGPDASRVRVNFYGRYQESLVELIDRYDLHDNAQLHGQIPHDEARRLQCAADMLLLLIWDHPDNNSTFTGKLFEYISTRRPILAIAPQAGVAAKLIRERNLGHVATTPEALADVLRNALANPSTLDSTPHDALKGLSREDQTRAMVSFFEYVLHTRAHA